MLLCRLTSGLKNLTRALSSIGKRERHDLVEPRELDLFRCSYRQLQLSEPVHHIGLPYIFENDKRSVDTTNGVVPKAWCDRVGRRIAGVAHDCGG